MEPCSSAPNLEFHPYLHLRGQECFFYRSQVPTEPRRFSASWKAKGRPSEFLCLCPSHPPLSPPANTGQADGFSVMPQRLTDVNSDGITRG